MRGNPALQGKPKWGLFRNDQNSSLSNSTTGAEMIYLIFINSLMHETCQVLLLALFFLIAISTF